MHILDEDLCLETKEPFLALIFHCLNVISFHPCFALTRKETVRGLLLLMEVL